MAEANLSFNKRAFPRIPAHIPVTFMVMNEHKELKSIRELLEKTKVTQTLDASLGGLAINGNQGLTVGDLVTIKMTIPAYPKPISAFAEVVWVKPDSAGLRFSSIIDEGIKYLEAYFKSFSNKT